MPTGSDSSTQIVAEFAAELSPFSVFPAQGEQAVWLLSHYCVLGAPSLQLDPYWGPQNMFGMAE